jgi:uncharacterized membrane protein YfcA
MLRSEKLTDKKRLFLAASSALAGLANGLLGAGGGIILYFAIRRLYGGENRAAFRMNILAILVFSTISAAVYYLHGNLDIIACLPYLPVALLGGALGAFLLPRLKLSLLRVTFAAVTVYAGIRMLLL